MKFAGRLHNSNNAKIPAVVQWRHSYQANAKNTTPWFCRNSQLYSISGLLPIFNRRLDRRGQPPTATFLDWAKLKTVIQTTIAELDKDNPNVAGVLVYEPGEKYRYCLQANAFQKEKDKLLKTPLLRWLTGTIAVHKPCLNSNCGLELSRSHAISCSGAGEYLSSKFPIEAAEYYQNENVIINRGTILDYILNKHRHSKDMRMYRYCGKAISMVYQNCLHYRQKHNGFYAPREEVERENMEATRERRNTSTPPTLLQRLPSQPKRPG
jgi:hypothetical protein